MNLEHLTQFKADDTSNIIVRGGRFSGTNAVVSSTITSVAHVTGSANLDELSVLQGRYKIVDVIFNVLSVASTVAINWNALPAVLLPLAALNDGVSSSSFGVVNKGDIVTFGNSVAPLTFGMGAFFSHAPIASGSVTISGTFSVVMQRIS